MSRDITKTKTYAIVNVANEALIGERGIDRAIVKWMLEIKCLWNWPMQGHIKLQITCLFCVSYCGAYRRQWVSAE